MEMEVKQDAISLREICDEMATLRSRIGFLANAVSTCPPDDGVLADGEGLYFTIESIWSDLKALEEKVVHKHDEGRVVSLAQAGKSIG